MPGGSLPPLGGSPLDLGPRVLLAVAAAVAGAFLLALAVMLVSSVMEFVFVEFLREEEVSVKRFWWRRWRQGLRLFVFRLVLGLFTLATFGAGIGLVAFPALVGVGPGFSVVTLILLLPLLVFVALVVSLVNGFTGAFVVPTMIVEGCRVLDGWRRFWPTLRAEWRQYLVYVVVAAALAITAGLFVALGTGLLALALLVPFGLLGAVGFGLLAVLQPLGIAILVVVGLLFGLSVAVVTAFVQVPVVTYLKYFALCVLGDTDEELDLIPELREAVRSD